MMMWQPIETAPRDATAILVMRDIWPGTRSGRAEECNGHNTYVAAWWSDERGGQGAWICYMDAVLDPECPVEPTHWMPLPDPPGAQPAPSIPVEAIGKMLADVMAVAVSNGANSVSMPDEYVEVAVWLQGECPTQPAPSVPEGWKLVPIEPTPTMVKAGLESSHALNVHRVLVCYDAMIDAAPEAKP